MIALRSLVFNVLFYANTLALIFLGLPTMLLGRRSIFALAKIWSRSSLWLLASICGTRTEFRGLENIPKGAVMIASKHQSMWETFALLIHFEDFSFVLKRELTWIPFFGWYVLRAEQVAIDRSTGRAALNQVTGKAKLLFEQGRQLFIFPEGTRRPPGAPAEYKFGVAHIYAETGVACLPVALNSGLFWPRRKFLRYPGTIVAEFLPVIAPGLDRQSFLKELANRIEPATKRLEAEAKRSA